MSTIKQGFVVVLLFLLAAMVAFSSHPLIVDISRSVGIEKGSILSRYIVLVFVLLFALCFNWKEVTRSKTITTYFFLLIWVILFSFITLSFFNDNKLLGEVRPLAICLIALSIGWLLRLSDFQFRNVLLVYALCTLYVGLSQVMTNIGGFVIESQYLTDNKNSLGVMLSSSIVIFAYMAFEKDQKKIWSILYFGGMLFLLVIILTIRARASSIVAFFSILLIFYRKIKRSFFIPTLIVVSVLIGFGMFFVPSNIFDFVTSSFISGYEGGDVTSERAIRNQMALDYLSFHPILGNLQHGSVNFGWIHNYPLLQLFNNGLLFGMSVLVLYLYLFVIIIKGVFRSKIGHIRELGFFMVLVPFVVSMAEPTFPFGPGTATVFNFIAFGVALKHNWSMN